MFVDAASVLRELLPDAMIVLTWVCQDCSRGWTAPADWRRPSCARCKRLAEQRGAHAAVALR